MPVRDAEAFILRTFPLKESDKIACFLTREFGKYRGVCRGARRTKGGYGAALEPLTHVRIAFFERENRELTTVDRCEVVTSMMNAASADYATSLGLSVIAEVADKLLPDHEVNERVFRLLLVVLERVREGAPIWLPLTYYLFWMVRLAGFLPDLLTCAACGRSLDSGIVNDPPLDLRPVFFHPREEGLRCSDCAYAGMSQLSSLSRRLALAMLRTPLNAIPVEGWDSKETAQDLRRCLLQRLEAHLEFRLQSRALLEEL